MPNRYLSYIFKWISTPFMPSKEETLKIFCGNLPLGLCIVGSSLRDESKVEWEHQLHSLETSLDRKIEDRLRMGYDRLLKKHEAIFLHIACFSNNENVDYVT